MKLSGRYPKFNVGYSDDWDYYVSSSSNTRCKAKKIKVITDTDKNKIEYLYQKKLLKPITLKNGSSYNLTKFTYDSDCAPIDYTVCLRYAWQSVFTTGVNNNSVLKFKKGDKTYVGCMTDNWFPWYNRFVGYIGEGQSKVKDPYTGIFDINKCNKPGNEDSNFSGVVKVENILRDSGLGTDFWDNPPNALSPSSMGLSLQEFKLRGNLSVDWNLIYKSKVDFYDSLEGDLYTKDATGKYGLDNEWNDKTESYISEVYAPKIKNFIDKEKFEDGLIWVKSEYEVIKNDVNSNKEILLPWFKGAWDDLVEAFDNTYTKFSARSQGLIYNNKYGDPSKKKQHPATKPLYQIAELPKPTIVLNFDTATVDELKKLKEINYQGIKKYDHTTFWGKDPNQPTQNNPNDGELNVDEQIKAVEMMNQNMINSIKQGFILPSNGGTNFKRFG
jgi:hypothetical protein